MAVERADRDAPLYQAIGEFVVQFEQVVGIAALGVQLFLEEQGLASRRLSALLVAKLTADPIFDICFSLLGEIGGESWNDDDRIVVRKLRKRVDQLVETRNSIVHSQWIVGWLSGGSDDEEDPAPAGPATYPASRYWRDRSGFTFRATNYTVDDVRTAVAKALGVGMDLRALGIGVLDEERPTEIVDRLSVD